MKNYKFIIHIYGSNLLHSCCDVFYISAISYDEAKAQLYNLLKNKYFRIIQGELIR